MGGAGLQKCSVDGETLDEYEDEVGLTSSGGVSGAAKRWCGSRQFNTPIGRVPGAHWCPVEIRGMASKSKLSLSGLAR